MDPLNVCKIWIITALVGLLIGFQKNSQVWFWKYKLIKNKDEDFVKWWPFETVF